MADKETEKFLRTGRMSPRQKARFRLQREAGKEPTAGEVQGLFGKRPKPGQKKPPKRPPRKPKPPEGKPPSRTLPIRPDRKPPRVKPDKNLERVKKLTGIKKPKTIHDIIKERGGPLGMGN